MAASKTLCGNILIGIIIAYLIVSYYIHSFSNTNEPRGGTVLSLSILSNVLVSVGTFFTLIII